MGLKNWSWLNKHKDKLIYVLQSILLLLIYYWVVIKSLMNNFGSLVVFSLFTAIIIRYVGYSYNKKLEELKKIQVEKKKQM